MRSVVEVVICEFGTEPNSAVFLRLYLGIIAVNHVVSRCGQQEL